MREADSEDSVSLPTLSAYQFIQLIEPNSNFFSHLRSMASRSP